jgi:hypothetical protein
VGLRPNEPADPTEVQLIPIEQFEELVGGDREAFHCEEHVATGSLHRKADGKSLSSQYPQCLVPICPPLGEVLHFGNGPAMIGAGSDASQDFSQ